MANGFGGRMGKPLQDVVTGDIGVVVAENREHYVYITKVLPVNYKKTGRHALKVSTCCITCCEQLTAVLTLHA